MTLKAVVFDMDGVLTDTVPYHFRSWQMVCREYNIPFENEDNEKLLGLTRRRSLEVILGGEKLAEEDMQAILKKKNDYFLHLINEMDQANLLPGVEQLLHEIRQAGLHLAVASASRNAGHILERLGVAKLFDIILDGTHDVRSKPEPDVYLRAAAELGVHPDDCIAIEDSSAGIKSALVAGMCVVGVGQPQIVGKADAVLSSLERVQLADLQAIHRWWSASHAILKIGIFDDSFADKQ